MLTWSTTRSSQASFASKNGDRRLHALWEGMVLGCQLPQRTHALVAPHIQVQVGVAFELAGALSALRVQGRRAAAQGRLPMMSGSPISALPAK